jgi:prepilin-type N-terminal cleavage/methylation domain-containing protein
MLKKLQKRNSEGFTIIEVMIVLAIAALILLIVLLAVPALQRNSRNTQRKNDISAIVSATNEFVDNNNGISPTGLSGANSPVTIGVTGSGVATSNASVGFFNQGAGPSQAGCVTTGTASHVYMVTALAAGAQCAALTADSQHDFAVIVLNATCGGAGVAKYQSRSISVQYEIESSGGYTPECQSS